MSFITSLQSKQISTKTAVIAILSLCVVLALVYVFVTGKGPANVEEIGPAAETALPSGEAAVAMQAVPSAKTDPKGKVSNAKASKVEAAAKPADPYAVIAERNIFKPVSASAAAPPPAPSAPVPPMPVGPIPGAGLGAPGGGPPGNAKIAFTGAVQTPDGMYALLENLTSGETRYAKAGESAFGMQVTQVSQAMVSLNNGGQPMNLMMGENKTDTAAAAPTPPGPGGPPQPPGPPAMAAPAGAPDMAAMRERFMRSGGRRGRRDGGNSNPPVPGGGPR